MYELVTDDVKQQLAAELKSELLAELRGELSAAMMEIRIAKGVVKFNKEELRQNLTELDHKLMEFFKRDTRQHFKNVLEDVDDMHAAEVVDSEGRAQAKAPSLKYDQAAPVAVTRGLQALEERLAKLEAKVEQVEVGRVDDQQLDTKKVSDISKPVEVGGLEEQNPSAGKQIQTDSPIKIDSKAVHDTISQSGSYEIGTSVYDATLFMGSKYLTYATSLLIFLGFGLNMFVQILLIGIIRKNLSNDPFPPGHLYDLHLWRAADGHSRATADKMTGASLAARVCSSDEALSTATGQFNKFNEFVDYCDNSGAVLSAISILLWALCCTKEIRHALEFAMAVCILPFGSERLFTGMSVREDGLHIESIGWARKIWGCIIALARLSIAGMLCWYGSKWLAYTTSVEDLLLNASALGFALQIDEEIYGVLATVELIRLVGMVQPLRLPDKKAWILLPALLLTAQGVFLLAFGFIYLSHMVEQTSQAIAALCSPDTNTDIIMSINTLGWPMFSGTAPFGSSQNLLSARMAAVDMVIHNSENWELYALNVTPVDLVNSISILDGESALSVESLAGVAACNDIDQTPYPQKLGIRLWLASGNESYKEISKCSDVKYLCRGDMLSQESQNARIMCPVSCGCADITSGLFHLANASAGCPVTCWKNILGKHTEYFSLASSFSCYPSSETYEQEKADFAILDAQTYTVPRSVRCKDNNLTYLNSTSQWSLTLDASYRLGAINSSDLAALRRQGCAALLTIGYTKREILCEADSIKSNRVYVSNYLDAVREPAPAAYGLGTMCAETCGCFTQYLSSKSVFCNGCKVGNGC